MAEQPGVVDALSSVLQEWQTCNTVGAMKTLTVRLPEPLVADIEAEARGRNVAKSDVVRERLERKPRKRGQRGSLHAVADLIGSVDGLPSDLAGHKKEYLRQIIGKRAKRAGRNGQKRSG